MHRPPVNVKGPYETGGWRLESDLINMIRNYSVATCPTNFITYILSLDQGDCIKGGSLKTVYLRTE